MRRHVGIRRDRWRRRSSIQRFGATARLWGSRLRMARLRTYPHSRRGSSLVRRRVFRRSGSTPVLDLLGKRVDIQSAFANLLHLRQQRMIGRGHGAHRAHQLRLCSAPVRVIDVRRAFVFDPRMQDAKPRMVAVAGSGLYAHPRRVGVVSQAAGTQRQA